MVEGIIGKISGNFLISAFIPSFGFILLVTFIFEPIVPKQILNNLAFGFDPPTRGALSILAVSLVLGFVLYGLTIFNYKLLEGYYVLHKIRIVRRRRQRAALKLKRQIELLSSMIDRLEPNDKRVEYLNRKRYALKAQYDQHYPPYIREVMPTRFGNILKASESYPGSRYGIDGVTVWPRLVDLISPSFQNRIQESNNGLAFVINCLALSIAFSLVSFLASLFQFLIWRYTISEYKILSQYQPQFLLETPQHFASEVVRRPIYFLEVSIVPYMQDIYAQRSLLYLTIGVLSLGVAIGFYYVALPQAQQYGNLIRSAYDLFRFDLLMKFRQDLPKNLADEEQSWKVFSEFFAVGKRAGKEPINIEYVHRDKSTDEA